MRKDQPQIFLHIGMEKTGSTSIQRYLEDNRSALLRQAVFFPTGLGSPSQIDFAIFAANPANTRDLRATMHGRLLQKRGVYTDFRAYLAQTMAASEGCDRIIFSCEHLSSRLRTVEQIASLRSLLVPFSEQIVVVAYLRPQEKFLVSLYNTAMQCGHTQSFDEWLAMPHGEHLYYSRMLDKWAEVFGFECIAARSFDRAVSEEGLLEDFSAVIGLVPEGRRLSSDYRENSSLSRRHLLRLRRGNRLMQSLGLARTSHLAKGFRRVIRAVPVASQERFGLTGAQRAAVKARFAEDTNRLLERYRLQL